MLIHSKKIKEPGVPKYDIQAVKQPPCSLNRGVAPPQTKTNHKQDDSYRISKIPVFINPHLHLLAEFSRFWDKYLGRIGRKQHKMPLKSHIHYITIMSSLFHDIWECIIFLLFFFFVLDPFTAYCHSPSIEVFTESAVSYCSNIPHQMA